jgi:hypothetical protein
MHHPVSGQRDQGHPFLLARLKARRRTGGDAEPEAECLFAIKHEATVHLEEMAVRSNLNRPVGAVLDRQFFRLAMVQGIEIAGGKENLPRNDGLGQLRANRRGQRAPRLFCGCDSSLFRFGHGRLPTQA